jgi:small-conductance mechanosensitive channel/CRP-like cAMP-binding protein
MADLALGPTLLSYASAAGIHYQLPFVLLAWLAFARARSVDRSGLAGSIALYALAVGGIFTSALLDWLALEAAHHARAVAMLVLGLALIRIGGLFLFRILLPIVRLAPPRIVEDLATFAGYLAWGMVRLTQIGVDLGSIVTTSAVITAILAFAMQDTLGNILGGTTLQLENSIRLGDWIKVGDSIGRVVDIRWRSTIIETRNWETIVIPNAVLMKTHFAILGRRSGEPLQWRRWVWFSVAFGVTPQRVIGTVDDALRRADISHVARVPPPSCVVMNIADSTVTYALRYWLTDLALDDPTDSDVRQHIVTAFRRAGIPFAYPTQFLHVQKEGEKQQTRAQRKDLEHRIAVLRNIELFSSFTEAERRSIAAHLVHAPFLAGETVTRQGDVAHWLYLVATGDVQVILETADGERRPLDTIHGGGATSFFGEMGMLTGEPRTASVVALTDCDCYRLDKEGFAHILGSRPAIAEEISALMSQRRTDLLATRQELDTEARQRLAAASRNDLLDRIRRFFVLPARSRCRAQWPAAVKARPAGSRSRTAPPSRG